MAAVAPASKVQLGNSAVIHTTRGDIHCRLNPDLVPKTVENFVGHARSGYYDGVIFHRIIKKFVCIALRVFLESSLFNIELHASNL